MDTQTKRIIETTKPNDRFSVIAQLRHDRMHQCVIETRMADFEQHNYLCDAWGFEHCKMEKDAGYYIDHELIVLAKSNGMETSDYAFQELIEKMAA